MKLIDTHVHIFPDKIAREALEKLGSDVATPPSTDGTFFGTLKKMKEWNVDEFWVQSVATNAKQVKNVNDFAISLKSDKVFVLGSVFPHDIENSIEELKRLKSLGIKGVKLHPEYQKFDAADEKVFLIYEFLEKNNMLCYFHAGKDLAFMQSHLASPRSFKIVLDTFPKMKAVFAHLGGWSDWDAVIEFIAGSNAYLDTAFIADYITDSQLKKIFSMHPIDRILFATDAPWSTPQIQLDFIRNLKLNDYEMEKICFKNAEELKASLFG